jgi:hypothetical protein
MIELEEMCGHALYNLEMLSNFEHADEEEMEAGNTPRIPKPSARKNWQV